MCSSDLRGKAARVIQEAEGYREQVVSRSMGESERFIKVLTEYSKAPKVTRERLYLETMETVLSNTNKVMVDVKKGNSMFYLPLDKMMQKRQVTPAESQNVPAEGVAGSTTSTDSRENRRERFREREQR